MNRPHLLLDATFPQVREHPPRVAVLPWGATEAHNHHLPYGTDVILATQIAAAATEQANAEGAAAVVLPAIPFGNDEQQLDQGCTISFRTTTALAILGDVVRSLMAQGIDRLVIVNSHGGNQFKPLVRDLQTEHGALIVVADTFALAPAARKEFVEIDGDHADESETSQMLAVAPELVDLQKAGPGARWPFEVPGLSQPGVWTPRPWSASHPDTGSGDPSRATAEKGRRYVAAIVEALAAAITGVSNAEAGQLPYRPA